MLLIKWWYIDSCLNDLFLNNQHPYPARMTKVDARTLSREELHKRRLLVIQLCQEGTPVMQIVERTGLSWPTVNAAIKRYESGGGVALVPASRGRKPGTGRELSPAQESEIHQLIRRKRPYFLGLHKGLWDRETVGQLIERQFNVLLSDRLLANYLGRWGLNPRQNVKRGPTRCVNSMRLWLQQHYAEIQASAESMGAAIYWLNRPAHLDTATWFVPKVSISDSIPLPGKSANTKLTMLSVMSHSGRIHWMLAAGRIDADRQIQFIKALMQDQPRKKIFLIRHDPINFSSPDFLAWIQKNHGRVRIFPERTETLHKT